jgi:hypothetical protein
MTSHRLTSCCDDVTRYYVSQVTVRHVTVICSVSRVLFHFMWIRIFGSPFRLPSRLLPLKQRFKKGVNVCKIVNVLVTDFKL